jgi:hypothetical protein
MVRGPLGLLPVCRAPPPLRSFAGRANAPPSARAPRSTAFDSRETAKGARRAGDTSPTFKSAAELRDEHYEKQLKGKPRSPPVPTVVAAEPEDLDVEEPDDEAEPGAARAAGEDWEPSDEQLLPEETPPMEQLPAATVLERAAAMVTRADKFLTHEKVTLVRLHF